jgi:excinuclease ABC subunit C
MGQTETGGTGRNIYETLKTAARNAPAEPGVYIWRDEEGRIIYVGKARVLRNRLSSYFSGGKDVKTAALIRRAVSIETIILANEYEALLLENTLIKQHSPRYNINLKDGKTYPMIRVTAEAFPKIFRTRHIVEDGSLYYGPYPNIQAVDKLLELVEKLFPLRKCRNLKKRVNPCMYYHIGRCMAPCCGKIDEAGYKIQVGRVKKLLAGETEALSRELTGKMKEAAAALRFEEAAALRNAVRAVEELSEPSSVADRDPEGRDYIAWAAEGIFTCFSVFSMREGRMTGRELFCSRSAAGEDEALETFIAAYYSPDKPPPPKIFIQAAVKAEVPAGKPAGNRRKASVPACSPACSNDQIVEQIIEQKNEAAGKFLSLKKYFAGQFGFEPLLLPPDEKRHEAVLAMARQNALEELRRRIRERGAGPALDELRQVLELKNRPERIEGFDIAQLDGKHPVASLVSFRNGVPDKKNYRYFKLRSVVGIVDDFASMREAVHRRYSRLLREGGASGGGELPDLILIDGGVGQVNAAKGVLDELGVDCGIAGLAKRDEEIWLPHAKEPIRLSKRSEALKVLQFVRDETHRFATGLNQKLRSKDLFLPALESVKGIGPKRAAAIMKVYGSLEKIAATEPAEMAAACKITEASARAVRAAAKLALEDRAAAKKKLTPGGKRGSGPKRSAPRGYKITGPAEGAFPDNSAAALAAEAFAAEQKPDYEDG